MTFFKVNCVSLEIAYTSIMHHAASLKLFENVNIPWSSFVLYKRINFTVTEAVSSLVEQTLTMCQMQQ